MINDNISVAQLAGEAAKKFANCYGRPPQWIVAAPGRVNLIGEHIDYNDGFVLPMAIECYNVIAADWSVAAKQDPGQITWYCARKNERANIPLLTPMPKGEPKWANYVRGVMSGFQDRGIPLKPLQVLMTSNVPMGGGLSSSAALEVATATLLETVTGHKLDPVDKALLCQKAEHIFAEVPCGIMDQFTSTLGREGCLLLLDCRNRKVEWVPMSNPDLSVLITNTNVRHELSNGEYAQRRKQCETAASALGVRSLRDVTAEQLMSAAGRLEPVIFQRARHVVSEIARTVEAAAAIRAANWSRVGQLMYESHFSLRDDYEVSCHELDVVVDIAREIGPGGGVIGCRMTGGGFGGCTVSLVKSAAVEDISRKMDEAYETRAGRTASFLVSRPAAGAMVVKS